MAKKLYEIEVNNENLTSTSKSKANSVVKSVAEQEVESFGIVEINNASSVKKVSKKADAGYEKNVTVAKKRPIKAQVSEVEDYADFCFRKTAKPVAAVEAEDSLDLLEYIKEILSFNVVENNDVKKKIATPSKTGNNDGLAEYYCKMSTTPFYGPEIDTEEMISYIKEILNFDVAPRDEVEAKIMKPSTESDNEGLAEYYYNRVIGEDDTKDEDYYDIIEYIKEVLNFTATVDEEINEMIESQAETPAKKTAKKTTTKKTCTTKKASKKKDAVETVVYTAEVPTTDVIKDACESALSEEAERVLCVARMGALFDFEKTM